MSFIRTQRIPGLVRLGRAAFARQTPRRFNSTQTVEGSQTGKGTSASSPSPPPPKPKSNSSTLVGITALAAAGGLAYYYYGGSAAPVKTVFPAEGGGFVDLTVEKIIPQNHNVRLFRFAFPDPEAIDGLKVCSAVLIKFTDKDGKNVLRPYTPISDTSTKGHLDLMIKHYENGPGSSHMFSLKEGDKLAFKGPLPKYEWSPNKHPEIVLLGGGTGITPLYQLINAILTNPVDKTKVKLIFGNITNDDILLKDRLDALAKQHPEQFKVIYALDKPPKAWQGIAGYIKNDDLKKELPPPNADNIKIFVCGPPGFYKALSGPKVSPKDQGELTGTLKDLGYSKEQIYKF